MRRERRGVHAKMSEMQRHQEGCSEKERKPGGNRYMESIGLKVEAAMDRTKLIRKIQIIPATADDGKNLWRFRFQTRTDAIQTNLTGLGR